MVRLSDLPEISRQFLIDLDCPVYAFLAEIADLQPWYNIGWERPRAQAHRI